MGKREENRLAKELKQKCEKAVGDQMKGTGWRKKHHTYFRQSDELFICLSAMPFIEFKQGIPTINLKVRSEVKPMSIDPIFWDLAQMPDNKSKPLSFRAWAAHKCMPLYCEFDKVVGADLGSPQNLAHLFQEWVSEEHKKIISKFQTRVFSDHFKASIKDHHNKAIGATTLICALISEQKIEEALKLAEELAPGEYRNLFNKTSDNRMNFYELVILKHAGPARFKAITGRDPEPKKKGLFARFLDKN